MLPNSPYYQAIRSLGTLIQVKKHDLLSNRAQKDKYVYCLEQGLCALHSISTDGREQIYQYFFPGDFVGFIPAFVKSYSDETFYAFSITAKSACTLYQIPYRTFLDYVDTHPDFYRWLFQVTVSHYDNALRHSYALQEGDNITSLCHALMELSTCQNGVCLLPKDFSYPELSNYLGVHTITVTRLMARLKEAGIISKQGHQTIIQDMDGLTALAEKGSGAK